jgi:Mrp family chromosome partitioning ATPase
VTDEALPTKLCDGAVLVARRGRTSRAQVRDAEESLANVDGNLLGTVLDMAPAGRNGYGYGYLYGQDDGS